MKRYGNAPSEHMSEIMGNSHTGGMYMDQQDKTLKHSITSGSAL